LGVGRYTINFTTALPDANYAAAGANGLGESGFYTPFTTTSVNYFTNNSFGNAFDAEFALAVIFR
jgi:hypothetical protein